MYFEHNHGGFFSNCNIILSRIINYFNKNKQLPIDINTQDAFTIYKTQHNEDIYKFVFSNESYNFNYENEVKFNDECYENQFSNYKLIKLNDIQPFLKKYFNLNMVILDNINILLKKYNIELNNEICGVFYRGNDKIKETQKPSYDEFILKAKQLKEKNMNIKFIVQTDELEFRNIFLSNFPNSIFFQELPAINSNNETNVSRMVDNKIEHVINFVSVIYIYSKLKYLITTSGNCELFIILYRNNTDNLFQYLNKNKYIHGSLNKDFNEDETTVWY